MKLSFFFQIEFQIQQWAYFSHLCCFPSIWCKSPKITTFDCHILLKHFSCGWCNAMTSYTNLLCKSNVLFTFIVCRCVSLSAETVRSRQNILTIEQLELLYTLQNQIDKYINRRKTLELIRLIFNLIKYYLTLFPQHLRHWWRHFSHNFFTRRLNDMLKLKCKLIHLTLLLMWKSKIHVSGFRTQFLTFYFHAKCFNMNLYTCHPLIFCILSFHLIMGKSDLKRAASKYSQNLGYMVKRKKLSVTRTLKHVANI